MGFGLNPLFAPLSFWTRSEWLCFGEAPHKVWRSESLPELRNDLQWNCFVHHVGVSILACLDNTCFVTHHFSDQTMGFLGRHCVDFLLIMEVRCYAVLFASTQALNRHKWHFFSPLVLCFGSNCFQQLQNPRLGNPPGGNEKICGLWAEQCRLCFSEAFCFNLHSLGCYWH